MSAAANMPRARLWGAYLHEIHFEFLKSLRTPAFSLPTLFFPVMFYLLFGIVLGSMRGNFAMSQYTFATYGVFGAMGPGLFGFGVSLALEREQGLLTLKQALPSPPGAYLLARAVMAMVFVAVIALLLTLLAVLVGHVPLTPGQAATLFAIDVLGALPFCAIGMFIGSMVSGQASPAIVNLIFLPMAFLSGLWLPLQFMPKLLADIAPVWPSYHLAQLALQTVGAPSSGSAASHIAVLAGVALVFFLLAVRRMQGGGFRLLGARPRRTLAVIAGLLVLVAGVAASGVFGGSESTRDSAAATGESAAAAGTPVSNTFAIRNVRLFDGEKVIEGASVIVRDGIVTALGPDAAIPREITPIEGTGKTLLPGLIDAHVHTYGDSSRRDALRFGVTTEIDMFTDWRLLAAAQRERESADRTDRADLYSAGTLVTAPGGHGTEYPIPIPTLHSAAEADAFVDARVREGSDFIKLVLEDGALWGSKLPSLTVGQATAVITAAHARGKLAAVHVATERDALNAFQGGADILAHLFTDRVASDELISAARTRKACVIATLAVIDSTDRGGGGARLAAEAAVEPWLSAEQRGALRGEFPLTPKVSGMTRHARDSVRRLHDAGVIVLAGTDAGNPGTAHGASLHQELEMLVAAGLPPLDALRAATSGTARCFDLDRGRIAVGARADLVLVDGNPLADIRATRNLHAVWKNGYAIERAATRAAPAGASAPAPAESLISDFDAGTPEARYGVGWMASADNVQGGNSNASIAVVDGGAQQTAKALEISGAVGDASAYPWAGAMFFPQGPPMQGTLDYSGKKTFSFFTRGDGRQYAVMIFSGDPMQPIPATQSFDAGEGWREVSVSLDAFAGADLKTVRGFGIMAGGSRGPFRVQIDQVRVH